MKLEFGDEALERLWIDRAFTMGLSVGVVKAFRRKVQYIVSAEDERDLRNWRSLHFEKLKGDRQHQHSIRLNDQYRLILEIVGEGQQKKLRLVGVEDYH